jgi:DNA-binding NtrC family response regulator
LRLMVVGDLDGRLAVAARIAVDNGAPVRHADGVDTAIAVLGSAGGADLLMADAAIDIRSLAARLDAASIQAPVVACGTPSDTATAVAAIHAGAREYIPLPEDPLVIAAILAAVAADDFLEPVFLGPRTSCPPDRSAGVPPASFLEGRAGRPRPESAVMAKVALAAGTVTRALVGRTVADVERDLILETLKRCLGNRTHAAGLLGISIRTLRNKLAVYAAEGVSVPPPNNGEIRGAA